MEARLLATSSLFYRNVGIGLLELKYLFIFPALYLCYVFPGVLHQLGGRFGLRLEKEVHGFDLESSQALLETPIWRGRGYGCVRAVGSGG